MGHCIRKKNNLETSSIIKEKVARRALNRGRNLHQHWWPCVPESTKLKAYRVLVFIYLTGILGYRDALAELF